MINPLLDDTFSHHEFDCYGCALDWITNPGVFLRGRELFVFDVMELKGLQWHASVLPYIYGDIGGADRWTWFVLANLLSLAAICPFVGSISDIMGRRYIALIGGTLLIIGNIVCATANDMNIFIGYSQLLSPTEQAVD
jgi:MFS family permease